MQIEFIIVEYLKSCRKLGLEIAADSRPSLYTPQAKLAY